MPTYEIVWKELRYVTCIAEVEADTKEEAVAKAQSYEADVEEIPGDGFEQFEAYVKVLEE